MDPPARDPARWIVRWTLALDAFAIPFADRQAAASGRENTDRNTFMERVLA
jgi:hypothetical protein